jgi:hypothetical protein
MKYGIGRVPLFGEDTGVSPVLLQEGQQDFLHEIRRQGTGIIGALTLFSIVNAGGMISANPLAPAVEMDVSPHLVPGLLRIADEPEVGLESTFGQRSTQTGHSRRNAARPRVLIGALER